MMKQLLFTFFICVTFFSQAQSPWVKLWDKRFGGTDYDFLTCFQETSDGGFILGGYSKSNIGGDKTQDTIGDYDYWIVKVDSIGNKLWDKTFGGLLSDQLFSIEQ